MTARNISIEAYHKHLESGKALVQWVRIVEHLRKSLCPLTRAEIAQRLNMRDSSVCGRVNELLKAKLVVEHNRQQCSVTLQQAHPIGINYADPPQGELI